MSSETWAPGRVGPFVLTDGVYEHMGDEYAGPDAVWLYTPQPIQPDPARLPALTDASFEQWAQSQGFNIDRDDSDKYREYHRATTRWAWLAWQAASARAVAFIRARADRQEQTNREYPEHAKCYPSWQGRVIQFRWLAEDLERDIIAASAAPAPEQDAATTALRDAATSLETIASLAGRKSYGNPPIETFMDTFSDVRLYAAARAKVARGALSAVATAPETRE